MIMTITGDATRSRTVTDFPKSTYSILSQVM